MTPDNLGQPASDSSAAEQVKPSFTDRTKGLFSRPHLTYAPIVFIAWLMLTNAGLSLINQPTDYWFDHSRASGDILFKTLLKAGPIIHIGVYLLFAILISLALRWVNYRLALVVWLFIGDYHMISIWSWLHCGLSPWFDFSKNKAFCTLYREGIITVLLLIMGILLVQFIHSLQTSTPEIRSRFPWRAATIPATWFAVILIGVSLAGRIPETGWKPIITAHSPSGRTSSAIVYDTQHNKAILFGGATGFLGNDQWLWQRDTWEWDGTDWTQLFPSESPPARIGHAMAYDEKRGMVVLFGGHNQNGVLNDTWEFDGKEWYERCPPCNPSARDGHQMIYDPQRGKVVLYGGYDHQEHFFNDAWEWDGTSWHQIALEASPVASAYTLAYDQARGRAIAFLSGSPNGTWSWEEGSWSRLQLTVEPPDRSVSSMAYDLSQQQIVMFGGYTKKNSLNDTWIFDGTAWTEFKSRVPPPIRWGSNLFYDPTRQQIVLFGGGEGSTFYNDMWELVLPNK